MDLKLELIVVPVSDVDRAVDFYAEKLGFRVDVDHRAGDDFRVVQLTPPGSQCSITVGIGISPVAPGTYQGMHLVVTDIEEAGAELGGRGSRSASRSTSVSPGRRRGSIRRATTTGPSRRSATRTGTAGCYKR